MSSIPDAAAAARHEAASARAATVAARATRPARSWRLRPGAGIEGLALAAHPAPPAPLQGNAVRVRMHAVALNHRDLMVARGVSGAAGRALVPASDGAGVVVAVGPGVSGLAVGDRVMSSFFPDWLAGAATASTTARALGGSMDGVLAEEVVLPDTAWVPIPDALPFEAAATLPCAGLTAWHALFGLDPLPPRATIALLGTGGVSVFALQLAKAAGHRVIATSSDDAKLARMRALGADLTLNYRRTPDWGAALHALAGDGVDRVLDIGGPDTIARSIAALRMGGTVAVIGRITGTSPAAFDPAALFAGQKRLAGLMVGSRAMAQSLARFVADAQIQPVIDRVFEFEAAPDAFRWLAAGRHVGKVVVRLRAG